MNLTFPEKLAKDSEEEILQKNLPQDLRRVFSEKQMKIVYHDVDYLVLVQLFKDRRRRNPLKELFQKIF